MDKGMVTRTGGCGKVKLSVEGEPTRIGPCHCTDCPQESGSAFTYFGARPRAILKRGVDN